jgi:very-long-chain enoyl-CoA reductase
VLRLHKKCFHCSCETNKPPGKPIRRLPKELTVSTTSPTSDIYNTIAQKSGYSVHRLRITKGGDGSPLSNGSETVQETGLKAQSVVYVKDLGKVNGSMELSHTVLTMK